MGQDLLPDNVILTTIFPTATPASVQIVANTWATCTFRVQFNTPPESHMSKDLIVRLETSNDKLAAVAALETLARTCISDLVPATYCVGQAITADGRAVEFSISAFVTETETLESLWPSLDVVQKKVILEEVIAAIKKLQGSEISPKAEAHRVPLISTCQLLTDFVAQYQLKKFATSSIEESSGGVTITSALPNINPVSFSNQQLKELDNTAVFCHNDMEPRNILIRRTTSGYKLAAIIDWETASIAPFAFETAAKDTHLGASNQYFDWYSMYKSATKSLIPDGHVATKLICAVHLIVSSRQRQLLKNVSAEIERRWVEMVELEMHEDVRAGMVKKEGAKEWKYDKGELVELELQVLKDFGRI
ncbi:hypothetical protein HBI23_144430 [Parastagonospora nodorum]|nr:hypothetical protein HBI23_144430 [Parastagonospora nodorum]